MEEKVNSYKIVWWNTSLCPPVNKQIQLPSNSEGIKREICNLIDENDMVILGEYQPVPEIQQSILENSVVDWLDLNDCIDKIFFRNGIFYKTNKIALDDYVNITAVKTNPRQNYRISQKLYANFISCNTLFCFYVIHWRSPAANHESIKCQVAMRLWEDIEDELNTASDRNIICIGDFNIEPFSDVFPVLDSSRHLDYVKQRGGFYNPFWRFLHNSGTIKYTNNETKCLYPLFDQILINHSIVINDRISFLAEILPLEIDVIKGQHYPIRLTLNIK